MTAKSTYADKNMEAYVERIKTNAEHLAKDIFPKKALELDELVNVNLNLHLFLQFKFFLTYLRVQLLTQQI